MIHKIYVILGIIINELCLVWWKLRDKTIPPHTDAVLFVAHPDDDTLFFHTFIKEHKPYVCLMTTGWSLRRVPDFIKCMRQYGVRFRIYPLDTQDTRIALLERHVTDTLKITDFKIVATHNATGEYGHVEHSRVHEAVVHTIKQNTILMCPVHKNMIENFPLDQQNINEKMEIFKNIYVTESWVPFEEAAGTPIWVTHERLEIVNR